MSAGVALVTGGSRGVGKGVATALGAAGWTVYVTGRGPVTEGGPLSVSARRVTGAGGTGIAVACDHRDDEDVHSLFARISDEQAGRLDLLVNNVWAAPKGFGGFSTPFWERPLDDWDSLIGVGLRAHYVASVEAARLMVPRRSGLIANISSFGTRGHLHSVLYGMSKAGLDKMASDMAAELAPHDVRAVSLWPGIVRTEMIVASGLETIAGFPVADAESPEFIGEVICALHSDPTLPQRSGHTFVTAELAVEYGITETQGRTPPSHREPFGGGPLF
ncbi:SDR family NAD(P)-dependent oxidoreductase [Rhodococcus opacus]|uniref:SDR family NAD(P)-dependent oxidoreductase n=1 Tax=Rhodococcus opacus TaxID=37919 RepID=UPI0022364B3A|nr:SDR family NAD(P)-dependent oxidoreductase [Rhodococcus opacus]UZG58597.1 SDR family NAD(P)-dependent oxidoreductase [Rhodococcus opacus]